MPRAEPRLLTIAGSDSGGGAGIQADLKTFAAHGAYGMSVITAVTAQNTERVTAIHPVPVEVVGAQIDAVFEDLGVDAVKIGMLGDSATVRTVARHLRQHLGGQPVVLDPVMVAKSGDALLAAEAVEALITELLPLATVVTPNLPEAAQLVGYAVDEFDAAERAGRDLARGGAAALVKGGHGSGDRVFDTLVTVEGVTRFEHPRIDSRSTHGTGCTLSSAIAARLGRGDPLVPAVRGAIDYLQQAIRLAPGLGRGHGPVAHFPRGVADV